MDGLTVAGIVDLAAKLTAIGVGFVVLVLLINAFRLLIEVQRETAKSNAASASVTAGALALMADAVDRIDKRVVDFGVADKQRSDQLGIDIGDVPEATHRLVKPDITSVETAVVSGKDEVLGKLVIMTERILELLIGQKSEKKALDEKDAALSAHASAEQAAQTAADESKNRDAALMTAVQTAVDKTLPSAVQVAIDKTLPPVQDAAVDKTLPPAVQEAIDKTLPPALKSAIDKTLPPTVG